MIVDYVAKEGDDPGEQVLNFEIMLHKISGLCNNSEVEDIIGMVLDWKLHTEENMLKILCDLDLEHIAA